MKSTELQNREVQKAYDYIRIKIHEHLDSFLMSQNIQVKLQLPNNMRNILSILIYFKITVNNKQSLKDLYHPKEQKASEGIYPRQRFLH